MLTFRASNTSSQNQTLKAKNITFPDGSYFTSASNLQFDVHVNKKFRASQTSSFYDDVFMYGDLSIQGNLITNSVTMGDATTVYIQQELAKVYTILGWNLTTGMWNSGSNYSESADTRIQNIILTTYNKETVDNLLVTSAATNSILYYPPNNYFRAWDGSSLAIPYPCSVIPKGNHFIIPRDDVYNRGEFRMQSNQPVIGHVLTCTDAEGTARWQQPAGAGGTTVYVNSVTTSIGESSTPNFYILDTITGVAFNFLTRAGYLNYNQGVSASDAVITAGSVGMPYNFVLCPRSVYLSCIRMNGGETGFIDIVGGRQEGYSLNDGTWNAPQYIRLDNGGIHFVGAEEGNIFYGKVTLKKRKQFSPLSNADTRQINPSLIIGDSTDPGSLIINGTMSISSLATFTSGIRIPTSAMSGYVLTCINPSGDCIWQTPSGTVTVPSMFTENVTFDADAYFLGYTHFEENITLVDPIKIQFESGSHVSSINQSSSQLILQSQQADEFLFKNGTTSSLSITQNGISPSQITINDTFKSTKNNYSFTPIAYVASPMPSYNRPGSLTGYASGTNVFFSDFVKIGQFSLSKSFSKNVHVEGRVAFDEFHYYPTGMTKNNGDTTFEFVTSSYDVQLKYNNIVVGTGRQSIPFSNLENKTFTAYSQRKTDSSPEFPNTTTNPVIFRLLSAACPYTVDASFDWSLFDPPSDGSIIEVWIRGGMSVTCAGDQWRTSPNYSNTDFRTKFIFNIPITTNNDSCHAFTYQVNQIINNVATITQLEEPLVGDGTNWFAPNPSYPYYHHRMKYDNTGGGYAKGYTYSTTSLQVFEPFASSIEGDPRYFYTNDQGVASFNRVHVNILCVKTLVDSPGLRCRLMGVGSQLQSHTFNTSWSADAKLRLWIDDVLISTISVNSSVSDYRVKHQIAQPENVLSKLCSIPMFNYEIIEGGGFHSDGKRIGYFAHELQETFSEYPNLVHGQKDQVDKDGKMMVQSVSLDVINLLMKSIQELNQLVNQLSNEIELLKSKSN